MIITMSSSYILKQALLSTPIGILTITASEHLIHSITLQPKDLLFSLGREEPAQNLKKKCRILRTARLPLLKEAVTQLTEYFEGTRKQFSLPLDIEQVYLPEDERPSSFRKKVWRSLATIPYGQTRSYAHMARAIRNRNAVRAVGTANNANPFVIVLPCHRVINADGSIGGYAGGIMNKKYLLKLEENNTAPSTTE